MFTKEEIKSKFIEYLGTLCHGSREEDYGTERELGLEYVGSFLSWLGVASKEELGKNVEPYI